MKQTQNYHEEGKLFKALSLKNIRTERILGTNITVSSYGHHRELWMNYFNSLTPYNIGLILGNRNYVRQVLERNNIAISQGSVFNSEELDDAVQFTDNIGYPVILKQETSVGMAPVYNLKNSTQLRKSFQTLSKFDESILVEKKIYGTSYRVLYGYSKYMNMCFREDLGASWQEYKPKEVHIFATLGNGILKAFPGLRVVVFECVQESDSGKLFVTDILNDMSENGKYSLYKGAEKITTGDFIADMLFPELSRE